MLDPLVRLTMLLLPLATVLLGCTAADQVVDPPDAAGPAKYDEQDDHQPRDPGASVQLAQTTMARAGADQPQPSVSGLPSGDSLTPPEGSRLAFVQEGDLWAFDHEGGVRRLVDQRLPWASDNADTVSALHLAPGISPDGRWVAYTRQAAGVTSALAVVDWSTGLESVLVRRDQFAQMAISTHGRHRVVSSAPAIGTGLWWHPASSAVAFDAVDVFVNDGGRMHANSRHDVWIAPIDTGAPFPLLDPGQGELSAISPNGEWVAAFRVEAQGESPRALLTVKPMGQRGERSRVLFSTGASRRGGSEGRGRWSPPVAVGPVWAPDSRSVFLAYPLHGEGPEDRSGLFRVTTNGEAEALLDLSWWSLTAESDYRPFLSPDARWVAHTFDAAHTVLRLSGEPGAEARGTATASSAPTALPGYPGPYPGPPLPKPALQLWLTSLELGRPVPLVSAPLGIGTAAWSHEGSRVAVFLPASAGPGDLVVADLRAVQASTDPSDFDRSEHLRLYTTEAVTEMAWLSNDVLVLQRNHDLVLLDVSTDTKRSLSGVSGFSAMPAQRH